MQNHNNIFEIHTTLKRLAPTLCVSLPWHEKCVLEENKWREEEVESGNEKVFFRISIYSVEGGFWGLMALLKDTLSQSTAC